MSVAAAARSRAAPTVLVGDLTTLREAAELVGISPSRLVPYRGEAPKGRDIPVFEAGPALTVADRRPGRPSRRAGVAQLAYVDAAYELTRAGEGRALVTAPVSKAVIARSGARGASSFLGHTEWLQRLDGAEASVMCFASLRLTAALATTHVPIAELPERLTAAAVADAAYWLGKVLRRLGHERPLLAVCSLNPHAGESELLGAEEARAIVPGMSLARRRLRGQARLEGPVGAETAFRKAHAGHFAGVVAMYHDQATIPMKLVAFGEAVNVTLGLSIVRTSVDHGTAYDIAWRGVANAAGMENAMKLGARLAAGGPSPRTPRADRREPLAARPIPRD